MLLINPATEQFGGILSRYVPVGIPIAIGTLAAYLKKHGHSVQVADDEIEKLSEENIDKYVVKLEKPYIFGISILTSQAARAYEICRMLRTKFPRCYIIAGGIHATALPEEPLKNGVDFVVRGEGEIPLLKLYEALLQKKDWKNLQSLSYFDAHGRLVSTPDAPLIENLDEIPIFPYDLFRNKKYDMGFITSSRGCPFRCTYCSQRLMTGLTYRYRSAEVVVKELSILVNDFGQKHIVFYDDNFSIKKQRVIDLCKGIVEAGLHKKCSFNVQTRADNFYEDIVPYMKDANFVGVGFGMETGVERLAEEIVKGETVETHLKAIRLAQKWGIEVTLYMIFGLPNESHEDRMYTYKLVRSLGLGYTKFNNLIPYPGTKLYAEVKNSPEIKVQPYWKNFNSTLTTTRSIFDGTPLPYVPKHTTSWQLKRDIFRCNMGFYFTPRIFLNLLKDSKGPGFVRLPKYWWLKPVELYEMAKLGSILFSNFLFALLPEKLGGSIIALLTKWRSLFSTSLENGKDQDLPSAIDGTIRKVVVGHKHLINPSYAST